MSDASFERSPGQDGDVFAANAIDQRHGAPITIGYGRYGPNQSLDETLAVDDVMLVLKGRCQFPVRATLSLPAPATSSTCQEVMW